MIIIREFLSNFIKIRRTPMVLLHLSVPVAVTTLFLYYYSSAGYRIIPDVRSFFILLQIGYPVFVSITTPVFIQLDRNIDGVQNALGLTASRLSVYMGKLLFLLFFSALSMILYEVCFYIGVRYFMGRSIMQSGAYVVIFSIFLLCSLFLYLLHVLITFWSGAGISVLAGISGTIIAGLFENPLGDKIWTFIPWEWGVRFLKNYFGFSDIPVLPGIISMAVLTLAFLVLSLLWFLRWEGKVVQE